MDEALSFEKAAAEAGWLAGWVGEEENKVRTVESIRFE